MTVYRPICQVQREALFFADQLPGCIIKTQIINRINEALRMSKRMDTRLKILSPHYNEKEWRKDFSTGRSFEPFIPGSREDADV